MVVSIIVASARNGVIGKDNTLLWRLSDDLKLFKARTTGHTIIMGRKTYDSIGKPLPNRRNIVISRSDDLKIEGCEVFSSLSKAIENCKNEEEVFIIGGEQIYRLAEKYANRLYLTKVHTKMDGDAFFDEKPYMNWKEIEREFYSKTDKNQFDFEVILSKKP